MKYPQLGAHEVRGQTLGALIQRDEIALNELLRGDLGDYRVRHAIKLCKQRIARNTAELAALYPQTKKAAVRKGEKSMA